MTVIVGMLLVIFGLDPRTGKLNPKKKKTVCVDEAQLKNLGEKNSTTTMNDTDRKKCDIYMRKAVDALYNMNENLKASILQNQIQDCLSRKSRDECFNCAKTLVNSVEAQLSVEKKAQFGEWLRSEE